MFVVPGSQVILVPRISQKVHGLDITDINLIIKVLSEYVDVSSSNEIIINIIAQIHYQ